MMSDPDELRQMVEDCKARERKLDSWSIDFVSDMEDLLDAGRVLSTKQDAKLTEIWERVTG